MSFLRVNQPGMYSTVQDLGRPGHSALGVPRGGACDELALRIGNRLIGNPSSAAALEMTLAGGTFEFSANAEAVLTGADTAAQLISTAGTKSILLGTPFSCNPGDQLHCGAVIRGVRPYLCIRGGVQVPAVLGSSSTLPAAGFGGFQGRPLQAGDQLKLLSLPAASAAPSPAPRQQQLASLSSLATDLASADRRTIRVLSGAHADRFDERSRQVFFSTEYTVTPRSDRAGIRLQGAPIDSPGQGRLASEGMMHGCVQIPPGGQPIILMPDGPTTGGYPVIASVITPDLSALGQLRPLTKLRFVLVSLPEARSILAQHYQHLSAVLEA